MPRIAHVVTMETLVPYEVRLVLELLLGEVNTLRQQLGLPLRTPAQVRTAARDWMKVHPRTGGGG